MDLYKTLFEMSRVIQIEANYEKLAHILLERVADFTSATKGFIVVRENGEYNEKYQIRFEQDRLTESKRRFSRSLVREAIQSKQLIYSRDVSDDKRFAHEESVQQIGCSSILVSPLRFQNEVYGVIYLEKQQGEIPFSNEDRTLLSQFAEMAGLSISIALEREAQRRFRRSHESDLFLKYNFSEVVGKHSKLIELLEVVAQVADSDATVLIRGETGTGKELIARALYLNSARKKKPFVTLHCGALPETLFEAELFGHKKGAFTGAQTDRPGRISQAHGGTLFIDEVAEIPYTVQAKLLRFFQFGEFQRLGSDRVSTVDVRIVAATHQDIPKMIKEGKFREDLYYRLKVMELQIPPLRERKSDILLLIEAFLKKFWKRKNAPPQFSSEAMKALQAYNYPGNVRELAHTVERVCLLAKKAQIELDLLPPEIILHHRESGGPVNNHISVPEVDFVEFTNDELKTARDRASKRVVQKVERSFLEGLMDRHRGNITKAGRASGMQRTYLYKLLSRHGMRP